MAYVKLCQRFGAVWHSQRSYAKVCQHSGFPKWEQIEYDNIWKENFYLGHLVECFRVEITVKQSPVDCLPCRNQFLEHLSRIPHFMAKCTVTMHDIIY